MRANTAMWFKVAGACIAAGIVLMTAAFFLVGGNVWKLQSPFPVGISIAHDGVYAASDRLPATPEPPQAPEAPTAPVAPAAPAAAAAFEVREPAPEDAPGTFDLADRIALAGRAFACIVDAFA